MKIKIADKNFELNVEEAIAAGALKEEPEFPLNPGDVYRSKSGSFTPQLLVKVAYSFDKWQLIGLGCRPNSNYRDVLTLSEVERILRRERLIYAGNINSEILGLVRNQADNPVKP